MLRAAIRRAATTTRPYPATSRLAAARWSRCNSTITGAPSEEAGPSKQSAKPIVSKPTEAPTKTTQAAAAEVVLSDKEVDVQLNDALLGALQDIQLEVTEQETPIVVDAFDEPVFEAIPPTNSKYDPVNLPIAQEPDYVYATEEEWHASLVHGRSSLIPHQHKPVYRIPAATLHLRSHQQKLLDFYAHFVSHAAASLGIPISRVVHLPTQRSLWTVPRSPFAHKKSQENFERRTHKRAIKAWDADPEVIDRWFQYIRQHAMGGVGMRALRWTRMPLGVGATHLRQVKQALTTPQAQMKKLADKIVKEEAKKGSAAAPTQAS